MVRTTQQFKDKGSLIHNGKYGYSHVDYKNTDTPVLIECPIHGLYYQKPKRHLLGCGCPKCKADAAKRLVCGVGVNDMYNVSELQSYKIWDAMIRRCYSSNHSNRPTYIGCSVCEEWLTFSNFKNWYDLQPCHGKHGDCKIHLDKDIFSDGNGHYSPQTCCLIPNSLNIALVYRTTNPNGLPIGVYMCNGRYVAECVEMGRSRRKYIGTFDDAESAGNAYKKAKAKHLSKLSYDYYCRGEITERIYNGILDFIKRVYGGCAIERS